MINNLIIKLPNLKGINNMENFENLFYESVKDISFFNDTDKIISFIKESYENHKKESFWICAEFAFIFYNYIEDYFNIIKKTIPKEVENAIKYFYRISTLSLYPKKKENIRKNVWVIVNYFNRNKYKIKKALDRE